MAHDTFAEFPCDDSECEQQAAKPGVVPSPSEQAAYESPLLVDLGHVREVTLGSSPSGSADANAQYYW